MRTLVVAHTKSKWYPKNIGFAVHDAAMWAKRCPFAKNIIYNSYLDTAFQLAVNKRPALGIFLSVNIPRSGVNVYTKVMILRSLQAPIGNV
jgi:hypothetical protein